MNLRCSSSEFEKNWTLLFNDTKKYSHFFTREQALPLLNLLK